MGPIVTRMKQLTVLLLMIVYFPAVPGATATQSTNLFSHTIGFGDTWNALSLRFQSPSATLLEINPKMNRAQQPVPGETILIPDLPLPERMGTVVRLHKESLLQLAMRTNQSPYRLAMVNGLDNPYTPPLYQPILLPDDTTIIQELPAGFQTFQLSQLPAIRGQAIAFRGQADDIGALKADLRGLPFITAERDGTHFIGLGGTGAFYQVGQPSLNVIPAGHPRWSQPWPINDDRWDFQTITLTGSAANIDSLSIANERERLFEIWNNITPDFQFNQSMQLPIENFLEFTSAYGARRSYNGGPFSSYHEGVDFSAYGGTPVLAGASGTVVIAELLYVRGGAVIIDHGLGIYSGVYHLSEVVVAPGQIVEAGDVVGAVGTTGLSTGNHLHWDLLVNGIWVDALSWYNQDMSCWLLDGLGSGCIPGQ